MNSCRQVRCPCRTWTQCSRYNSKVWKDIHPDQMNVELHEWFDVFFRIVYEHGNSIANG